MPNLLNIILIFVLLLQIISMADLNIRIVNGKLVQPGQCPYIVSLSMHGSHFCGGSIISNRHILTAAHCLDFGKNPNMFMRYTKVIAGTNRLNANTLSKRVRTLKRIFKLPNPKSDIAILELNESLPINTTYIAKIALRNTNVPANTWCTVSGWGDQVYNSNQTTENLMAVNVSIVSYSRCYNMYRKVQNILPLDSICAGDDHGDSCQGDSGGPLVCNGYLTGIVASGFECAHKHFPGIYTNVSMHAKWINSIVNSGTTINNGKTGNVYSDGAVSEVPHVSIYGLPDSATIFVSNMFMSLTIVHIIMFCK